MARGARRRRDDDPSFGLEAQARSLDYRALTRSSIRCESHPRTFASGYTLPSEDSPEDETDVRHEGIRCRKV